MPKLAHEMTDYNVSLSELVAEARAILGQYGYAVVPRRELLPTLSLSPSEDAEELTK